MGGGGWVAEGGWWRAGGGGRVVESGRWWRLGRKSVDGGSRGGREWVFVTVLVDFGL